jgi:hypothetical protein
MVLSAGRDFLKTSNCVQGDLLGYKVRRFRGTYRLSLASAGFLLGLLFDPEDGVDMLLRIAGLFPTTQCYNCYNPEGRTFLLLHKGKKVKLSMKT